MGAMRRASAQCTGQLEDAEFCRWCGERRRSSSRDDASTPADRTRPDPVDPADGWRSGAHRATRGRPGRRKCHRGVAAGLRETARVTVLRCTPRARASSAAWWQCPPSSFDAGARLRPRDDRPSIERPGAPSVARLRQAGGLLDQPRDHATKSGVLDLDLAHPSEGECGQLVQRIADADAEVVVEPAAALARR